MQSIRDKKIETRKKKMLKYQLIVIAIEIKLWSRILK
jgi:hypothetical protein